MRQVYGNPYGKSFSYAPLKVIFSARTRLDNLGGLGQLFADITARVPNSTVE